VLRRISGRRREQETGGMRKLHIEKLHDFGSQTAYIYSFGLLIVILILN
jgi:hypothetical protein